jgi:hypothetical protein
MLVKEEERVRKNLVGQRAFSSMDYLDKVDGDNRYFKIFMKKLEKDPLYRLDYKK